MAGQSSAMIGWSWTDVSVLGSQVFGQALMDSCAGEGTLSGTQKTKKLKSLCLILDLYRPEFLLLCDASIVIWPVYSSKDSIGIQLFLMDFNLLCSRSTDTKVVRSGWQYNTQTEEGQKTLYESLETLLQKLKKLGSPFSNWLSNFLPNPFLYPLTFLTLYCHEL